MARKKVDVDRKALQDMIDYVEANRTFTSRSELFQTVAATEWAKAKHITAPVITLRFVEFNLTCKTQPHHRRSGTTPVNETYRRENDNKVEAAPADSFDLELLRQVFLKHGIEVKSLEDVLTCEFYSEATNVAVRKAWLELRLMLKVVPPAPKNTSKAWDSITQLHTEENEDVQA